jgi:hypothetical protein
MSRLLSIHRENILLDLETMTYRQVSKKYNVCEKTIYNINKRHGTSKTKTNKHDTQIGGNIRTKQIIQSPQLDTYKKGDKVNVIVVQTPNIDTPIDQYIQQPIKTDKKKHSPRTKQKRKDLSGCISEYVREADMRRNIK